LLTSTVLAAASFQAADLANLEVQVSTNLVDWPTLPGALTLANGAI
jgi:hypothetical protein